MLDEQVRELLDGRAFAVLATLNSDGTPLGQDPPPDPPGSHRLIGRLTPERVTGFST